MGSLVSASSISRHSEDQADGSQYPVSWPAPHGLEAKHAPGHNTSSSAGSPSTPWKSSFSGAGVGSMSSKHTSGVCGSTTGTTAVPQMKWRLLTNKTQSGSVTLRGGGDSPALHTVCGNVTGAKLSLGPSHPRQSLRSLTPQECQPQHGGAQHSFYITMGAGWVQFSTGTLFVSLHFSAICFFCCFLVNKRTMAY